MTGTSITGAALTGAIAAAINTAAKVTGTTLRVPCCDAEDWTLCEDLLMAFGYGVSCERQDRTWTATHVERNISVKAATPRDAVLNCFVAHMATM